MKKTRQPPVGSPRGSDSRGAGRPAPGKSAPGKGGTRKSESSGRPSLRQDRRQGTVGPEVTAPNRDAPTRPSVGQRTPLPQTAAARGSLLYGLHPVAAAWLNPDRRVRALFATEGALESLAPALARAEELGIDRPAPSPVDRDQLDRLLPAGAVHQGAALDCSPLPELDLEDVIARAEDRGSALIVILDQVTDPHNVGAILRSAAAFGAMAVIVQDRHAPPVTGVLAKTASGAVDAVPLVRVTNLARAITDLQQAGFWCVGLAESGTRALHELEMTDRTALVLGSEGDGIRRLTAERCDEIAHLPTGGPVGSLNVSNAAAVALYEVARRR